jgi:nucleotide-binding universal stress UspA family protein
MAVAPLGKILLYVDATEGALAAARYAIVLAKTYGAELHAVYVVNERMLEELLRAKVFVEEEEVDLERDLEEDARRYLAYVERLANEKDLEINTELLRGVVHREVVDKAAEVEAQLIVIGKIYEQLSRMDSYYDEAEEMLRRAKCPVLIVKGETIVDDLYESL